MELCVWINFSIKNSYQWLKLSDWNWNPFCLLLKIPCPKIHRIDAHHQFYGKIIVSKSSMDMPINEWNSLIDPTMSRIKTPYDQELIVCENPFLSIPSNIMPYWFLGKRFQYLRYFFFYLFVLMPSKLYKDALIRQKKSGIINSQKSENTKQAEDAGYVYGWTSYRMLMN